MMCSVYRNTGTRNFTVSIYFICFINSLHSVISENDKGTHRIGGIFSSRTSAQYLAAEMALNDIAQYYSTEEGLISFRQIFLDVECGDEETLKKEMMSNPDVRIWLAGCQSDCLTLAEITEFHNRTDIVILCYSITELPFEESQQYKNLFSIESNAYSIAQTYAQFIVHCQWDDIAVIYQEEENRDKIAKNLIGTLHLASVNETVDYVIGDDTLDVVQDFDPEVIVCLCDAATARRILCDSYSRKLYGADYIWLFPGSYEHEWYQPLDYEDLGCSVEMMQEVAYGHFIAKSLNWNHDANINTYSGKTAADFKRQLHRDLERVGGHYIKMDNDEAALAYDAIWASVLGIREETKQDERLSGSSLGSNYVDLNSIMQNVSFLGISGDFSFNPNRGRSITNSVVQMEIYLNHKYKPFGQHIYKTNKWTFHEDFGDSCNYPLYQPPTSELPTSVPSLSSFTPTTGDIIIPPEVPSSVMPLTPTSSSLTTSKKSGYTCLLILIAITLLNNWGP